MHIVAILNRDSGTFRTMDLSAFCASAKSVFESHGHRLDCEIVAGADIEERLQAVVAAGDVEVLLAGGGDGTISSAAAIAFESGTPLAVLPAGTMNLFARALGVPLALEEAVEALASGHIGSVDIGTANGKAFVHQFGVGIHARLVRIRQGMEYGSRIGKILASLRAILAAVAQPISFEAELVTPKGSEKRRVAGIAVSNNRLGDGHMPHADRLDAGVLGVYAAAPMSGSSLMRLLLDVFLGSWRNSPMVTEAEVTEVILKFPKRKRGTHAVIDGELIPLEDKVQLKIHPRALRVLLPNRAV